MATVKISSTVSTAQTIAPTAIAVVDAVQLKTVFSLEESSNFAWVLLALITSTELSVATKFTVLTAPATTGFFAQILDFLENVGVATEQELNVSKGLQEQIASINTYFVEFSKPLTENLFTQEKESVAFLKSLQEINTTQDESAVDFIKAHVSPVSINNQSEVSFSKSLIDPFTAVEHAGKGLIKPLIELPLAVSKNSMQFIKPFQNQSSTVEESKSNVDKALVEKAAAQDATAIQMLFNRVFDDSFKQQDISVNHITKVIQDGISLFDEFYMGKLQENPAADTGLFAELHTTVFTKQLSDLGKFLETVYIGLNKSFQDAAEFSMNQRMFLGKVFQEQAKALEATEVGVFKPLRERMAAKDSGSVYLQTYAGNNYFEANYTGTEYSI